MLLIKDFVLKTVEHYYNKFKLELNEDAENGLSEFIHNSQVLLLQACLQNNNQLVVYTKIEPEVKNCIIFYKTSLKDLANEDSVKDVNIVTVSDTPAESLYHILKQIYTPLLASGSDLYSRKLQKNLLDLESNLRVLTNDKGHDKPNAILSIDDEVEYWRTIGQKKDVGKKEKEAASTFLDLFEDICEEIRSMQLSTMPEFRESVENIGGLLDDVWRFTTLPYSFDRMVHIFDVVGHTICLTLQKTLSATDIWMVYDSPKDNELITLLNESLKVMECWTSACRSLTETYWPNYALHPWKDKPYTPKFCLDLQARIKEVRDIRSTHNQLNKLLTNIERSELNTEKMFKPFEKVNIWGCNGPNFGWESALSRYTANLRPAEAKIAEKLKPRLHNMSTKQMLYEFTRYKTLINRPLVKLALNHELEIFVSSLMSMLKDIKKQIDTDDVDVQMYQPPELSPIVQQVQWAKQLEAKVQDIHTCAERDLKEFDGSSELLHLAEQVLDELKTMYSQLYEEWCRDLQTQAKNGSLKLEVDKPVVVFSPRSRLMEVQFNGRLVRAELESRVLSALGFPLPSAMHNVHTLVDCLQHARPLQQVASFHNTLAERMIPSTRPMMLSAALDLSSLLQNHAAVYWDDIQLLKNYTGKLKAAVVKLETQNTYLTGQHVAIRGIVVKLMDTELLAKQNEWKKQINEIRDIIEKVEANGYKNTELWRSHWDRQIYKALECQYIKTLLSLHKYFPRVNVDLVLRGRSVRVFPTMEELRSQHYSQLRRFISLPNQFAGLHTAVDAHTIFEDIVTKHSWLGNKAVKQLEEALSDLEKSCVSWSRRAALACIEDLQALCDEHLREPEDWEHNFKACKAYGQAVAKMTFEDEKIHWICVGTATLRREFESQARNLWACLMSSLQTSCRNDMSQLDTYIANATLLLDNKAIPKNAKELADVSAKQQALRDKIPEIEKIVDGLKRKSHMLRTWGGDPTAEGTIEEWSKIRELMYSQQQIFEHQAEIVKSSLTGEMENLNTSLEAWVARWTQTRSKFDETIGLQYSEMIDRCRCVFEAKTQWDQFVTEREEITMECEKFNMDVNICPSWLEGEKIITDDVNTWTVIKEYNKEYESIAEQDWIVFQKKLYSLEEFTSKWSGQLEPYTTVTLYLQQDIDKYTDLPTMLKYLRGSDFTERHWREVYSLLNVEYKKPELLQVKDFLNVALNIKTNIKALQKLCNSASSEAAVRGALNDLELWYAGARFTIIYYNDKAKRQTPIVKDFKEVLSKVEEQEWAAASLGTGASGWAARLRVASSSSRHAHHAQRRWLYLEPILSNDEGELGVKFRKVDQNFRQVMRIFESDPRLSTVMQSTRLQPMLDSISDQLQSCQSALNQYIDEKRSTFPRLHFLSDDDLLELLGQARAGAEGREVVMQTHLKKLFPGIIGVRLGPGNMSITALCSHYDDTFQLDHPVDIDAPVEIWLKNLEIEMQSSLKNLTLKCIVSNSLQDQDPFSLPTQILTLAQNIRFTEQTEKAIANKELHKLIANIEKENSCYFSTEVEDEGEKSKRQALILQCMHYISVLKTLIDNNIASSSDWLWQKQLRFYVTSNKDVVAKMGLAEISYTYEYLGVNTGQFVRTDLADECFLILTQALHLGLVGNPFGPAGTGKTESVKALGGLVGRLVLVFNCDEAMDAECLSRLLSGVAVCGAWGCFDEFNRLSAATLAAASHLLATTLYAIKHGGTLNVNGKKVQARRSAGLMATLNPATRGYGGRRQLHGGVSRCLLRRAVLPPPPRASRQLLARLLAAAAPTHRDRLASDLHHVFRLSSTLLSGQRHYDWGLRALKAAVGSAAAALAQLPEGEIDVQRAKLRDVLRINNLSKLTLHDAKRFENILSLVFVDVPEESSDNADPINKSLETAVNNLGLIQNKLQVQKAIELHEQMKQRMGVALVGPPGSGKTTIRQLLKNALTQEGKTIMEYTICPKAMSRNMLLGHIDPDTRQWTDGVISTTALEVTSHPSDVHSWVICDGDIDPEWIEALNSVLDDNRLLTLPSGWRIHFDNNVNFIFETHSLEHASPATVSRLGIILLSDEIGCAIDFLSNWMLKVEFESENVKMSLPILDQAVRKCLQWFNEHRSDVLLKLINLSIVKQILTQFEYVIQNLLSNTSPEEIVFAAIEQSVLSVIKPKAVGDFHHEMSDIVGPPIPAPVPASEWVTEHLYMSQRLSSSEHAIKACMSSNNAHLMIIGPDACGKNLLAEYVAREYGCTVITINCTPLLKPEDIIDELKRNNVLRSGAQSKGDARVTILVKELHRAKVDAWGTSAVCSLLSELMRSGGCWWSAGGAVSRAYVSAARLLLTAGTRSPQMSVTTLLLQEPEEDELLEIARYYLRQSVDKNIQDSDISSVSDKVLGIYKEAIEIFDSQQHYKWNASHLKKLCENVKLYAPINLADLKMALIAESNATFRDRLISIEEKERFNEVTMSYLKCKNEGLYFMPKLRSDRVCFEVVEYDMWYQMTQKIINQCLTEYENNVFGESSPEVCSELSILCPAVARATNGEMVVIVGRPGVGRRAAAYMMASELSIDLVTIDIQHDASTQLRNALSSASEGRRTLVVIYEGGVNTNLLGALEAMRVRNTNQTAEQTRSTHDVKQNLGILICLDKDQPDLPQLIDKYPLLYTDCHMIWLESWSNETLAQIPQLIVQRLIKENPSEDSKERDPLPVEGFVVIYNSLDVECMKAPCRYVNFVKSYYFILENKRSALTQRQKMLSAGVEALRRARSEVAKLQAEAAEQEIALSEKQAKANQALDQIGATVRATTDKKEEMQALKKNIEVENEKMQEQKKQIEAELAKVEPVIAAARAAVGDIRPESLSEVRSLRAPPDVVRDVLEGVLRFMGIADTSWHSMKNFLSKRGVKEDIRNLDASQISSEALESVEELVERRATSFSAAAAKRASAACAPLAAWVRANLQHARALRRLQPVRALQRDVHGRLREAESQLEALSSGLATVDERVVSLKEQLGHHTRDAAALELKLDNAKHTLQAAKELLEQLADEYVAWERDMETISQEVLDLNIRSLLSAACLVYLPDTSEPEARRYIQKWSRVVGFEDKTFSVINFLSTTEKQLKWEAEGLPLDNSAIKNAVVIEQVLETNKCGFTPLIIDPDGDAFTWLKNALSDKKCDFVSQNSDKLQTAVQYAIRLGRILIITEVDRVHTCWANLISGVHQGSSTRLILYSCDVTLPMRLPPYYLAKLSILHFTARRDGLTDQLVHYALQQQKPEVNEKSKEIKLKKALLQKQQHELQENLLRDLSSGTDILHDSNLIASLNKTRATSSTINEALEAARTIESEIKESCEAYAVSAERAAVLTLAVKSLATVKPLIALPIDSIMDIYVDAVRRGGDINKINNSDVSKYLTRRIMERVLLALHKKDKYPIVLYLLKHILDDEIPDNLWQIFVGNYERIEDKNTIDTLKTNLPWLKEDCIKKLACLKITCEGLFSKLKLNDEGFWSEFQNSGNVQILDKLKLKPFEMIAAVVVMRPESSYRAVVSFVDHILGQGIMSGGGDVRAALEVRHTRPVLLLGAHAAADVLAARGAGGRAFVQVGVEEGRPAWEEGLNKTRNGGWLALIVGALPFTQELQDFITSFSQISPEDLSPDFRLWIITEDREIPPLLSNACMNIVLESPEGVKYNVMNTLSSWGSVEGDVKLIRLLACLALFHALVQERRAYIPHGWSQWYSWDWGEISACESVIRTCGSKALRTARAVSLALYAARVVGKGDENILETLHRNYLGDQVFAHSWKPKGFDMQLPLSSNLQAYISSFSRLPELDSPGLLCLPDSCRVVWENNALQRILSTLQELGTTVNVSKKTNKSSQVKTLMALWKKQMSGCPFIKADFSIDTAMSGWWGCVVEGEARQAACLARTIHTALARGYTTPINKVPEEWQLQWSGPDSPLQYLYEYCHRARAAHARLQQYNDAQTMPQEVELRSFLNPSRLLCCVQARAACELQRPLHRLAARTYWDTGPNEADTSSVSLRGLALRGAAWRGALHAPRGDTPHVAPHAPPITLTYVETEKSIEDNAFEIPIYSNENHEQLLMYVRAPLSSDFPRDTAVLNSVALYVAPVL